MVAEGADPNPTQAHVSAPQGPDRSYCETRSNATPTLWAGQPQTEIATFCVRDAARRVHHRDDHAERGAASRVRVRLLLFRYGLEGMFWGRSRLACIQPCRRRTVKTMGCGSGVSQLAVRGSGPIIVQNRLRNAGSNPQGDFLQIYTLEPFVAARIDHSFRGDGSRVRRTARGGSAEPGQPFHGCCRTTTICRYLPPQVAMNVSTPLPRPALRRAKSVRLVLTSAKSQSRYSGYPYRIKQ